MVSATACPECGEAITADAPQGICPTCLLRPMVDHSLAATLPSPVEGFEADPISAEGLVERFPHLEIGERIGQGGMGVVYRARQLKLDRLVALKVIRPDLADEPGFAGRFTREARAMARLNHPNIVTVHDFGDAGGVYYLVMELVDGGDLRGSLGHGRLTAAAALGTALQVCDALQYAHEQGVVHRDVKPENVLRDRRGLVKIADFGLAKLRENPTGEPSLTATRQVMGTPAYMAPEQLAGIGQVDHRADVYSLGVLLYEMLIGRLPVGRFDLPSEVIGTDEALDEVLVRALQHDPASRHASVGDLRAELVTLVEDYNCDLPMAWSPMGVPAGGTPAPRAEGDRETKASAIVKLHSSLRNFWFWAFCIAAGSVLAALVACGVVDVSELPLALSSGFVGGLALFLVGAVDGVVEGQKDDPVGRHGGERGLRPKPAAFAGEVTHDPIGARPSRRDESVASPAPPDGVVGNEADAALAYLHSMLRKIYLLVLLIAVGSVLAALVARGVVAWSGLPLVLACGIVGSAAGYWFGFWEGLPRGEKLKEEYKAEIRNRLTLLNKMEFSGDKSKVPGEISNAETSS